MNTEYLLDVRSSLEIEETISNNEINFISSLFEEDNCSIQQRMKEYVVYRDLSNSLIFLRAYIQLDNDDQIGRKRILVRISEASYLALKAIRNQN